MKMLCFLLKNTDAFVHQVKFTTKNADDGGSSTEYTSKLGGAIGILNFAFSLFYVVVEILHHL